ncbi:MAG: site-specific integrase [Bacteroidales bacterium]|nr:site-specific integrase [Bacteroidales bacterium]
MKKIEKRPYQFTIHLDKRRIKKNGKYPVKLRLYLSVPKPQRFYYSTDFEFDVNEFFNAWESKRVKREYENVRQELLDVVKIAYDVADKIEPFMVDVFEKKLFSFNTSIDNVFSYYQNAIDKFKSEGKISTSGTYDLSMKSIQNFILHQNKTNHSYLGFRDITIDFLNSYERWMVSQNRSLTTVSMYLRTLRAIFNNAISDNILDPAFYPFGRKKYIIPSPKGVKKALNKDQLGILFKKIPATEEQKKAKDFFFFSYACNGMNFKDISKLKYKDYTGETLVFYRAKTATTKRDQSVVIVYVNDFIISIIRKYGALEPKPDDYIFSLVDHSAGPEEQHRQLKNFIRFVNQHFTKFANANGITGKISTYWARHSFATNAIRSGASMEFVSEALSHSNLRTTQEYFAGFESEIKKDISNKLMQF